MLVAAKLILFTYIANITSSSYNFIGILYLCFILLVLYYLYRTFRFKSPRYGLYALLCILMLLAVILLYYYNSAGSRHLLPFIFIGLLDFSKDFGKKLIPLCATTIVLLFIFVFLTKGQADYEPPFFDQQLDNRLTELQELMDDKLIFDENADPWDNTIIWLYPGNDYYIWQNFYALPSGFGINLCISSDFYANFASLKSGYVLSDSDDTNDLCHAENKTLVLEYDDICIWKLH